MAAEFPDLTQFLENIALVEEQHYSLQKKSLLQNSKAVMLMTLHAAKGLEFETVFMTGMEEGLLPHSKSFMEPEQLEEERRLCYVGMTRAKEKLYFSYAKKRLYFGCQNHNEISRFIEHISRQNLEILKPIQSFASFRQNNLLI